MKGFDFREPTLSTSDLQGMKERHVMARIAVSLETKWDGSYDERCRKDNQPWPCDFERLRIAYEERGKALEMALQDMATCIEDEHHDIEAVERALNPNTESGA